MAPSTGRKCRGNVYKSVPTGVACVPTRRFGYLPLPSPFLRRVYIPTAAQTREQFLSDLHEGDDLWTTLLAVSRSPNISAPGPGARDITYCCHQFVLSRSALRRRPRSFYSLLYQLSMTLRRKHTQQDTEHRLTKASVHFYLERLWHRIFENATVVSEAHHTAVLQWRRQALAAQCLEVLADDTDT
eukprot:m.437569 g.437569  ORF g.437569 m.437569 type:complete len:186 (+) comp21436_c0_seq31:234-791(+)